MGEVKVNIPEDLEAAFEEAFPGRDKASAVLDVVRSEIAKRQSAAAIGDSEFEAVVDEVLRLREQAPYFSDEDIRKAREALRK
jgi:hypothetical protein